MALRKRTAAEVVAPRITPGRAKNAVAVAKIIGAALLPVVVPHLTRGAGVARDRWDRLRARRLGVSVDELASYTGRGGGLHARLAGAATALTELRDRRDGAAASEATETRLRQLTAVVRAAERMPASRRRAAHRAVATELDRIEQELLRQLGV